MTSIDDRIMRSVRASSWEKVYSARHFSRFGKLPAIRQALCRLAKLGTLRRVMHGLYYHPRPHPLLGSTYPSPEGVIENLMERSGAEWQRTGASATNELGLSEQVPAKRVVLTDGPSRKVKLGNGTIEFRHASPRNFIGRGRPVGIFFQALRFLRKRNIRPSVISHLRKKVDPPLRKEFRPLIPKLASWMQPIVAQMLEPLPPKQDEPYSKTVPH